MIEFKSYASSSKGNFYTAYDGETRIMIECGIPWRKIMQLLDFKTSEYQGVLVSHFHKDHSKSAQDAARSGLNVYASQGTQRALGLSGHRFKTVEAGKQLNIGSWKIVPFATIHDVDGSLGFLMANSQGEKLLFLIDSAYCPHRFRGLNVIAVECNYQYEILLKNIEAGYLSGAQKNRLLHSHFGLDNVIEFLKANDLSSVREIHLLHLSDGNSDEALFKRTIEGLTGKPVKVCKA